MKTKTPPHAIHEPQDKSHLANRFRLMDAAARLMARDGYAGTSMRSIAEEAGLTTGAIYAQFPGGKEELFLAIVSAVSEEVHRFVRETVGSASDPVEIVVRQAAALWDFFASYPSYAALVVRENIHGALGDPSPFVAQNAEAIRQLRTLFESAIQAKLMAPLNISSVMFWVTTTCMTFHGCHPLRETVWTATDQLHAREDFLRALRLLLTPKTPPNSPAVPGKESP